MTHPTQDDLLPSPISDEAAYVLWVFLNDLALACEAKYYAQIHRLLNDQMRNTAASSKCDETSHSKNENISDPPF